MKEPKKKFLKSGDLSKRYKDFIKTNLEKISVSSLDKKAALFVKRVESGKRLALENKSRNKDEKGRFLSKQQSENINRITKLFGKEKFADLDAKERKKAFEISSRSKPEFDAIFKQVKETANDTKFTPQELILNNDLFNKIETFAISSTITSWVNVDRLNTEIDKFETITIRDQNGVKKEVTPEQAKFLIRSANKKVMQAYEGGKFTAETRVTQSAKSLEIFVPDLDGLDSTEIQDELEGMKDDFFTYGS
jgi:hypothetical protein